MTDFGILMLKQGQRVKKGELLGVLKNIEGEKLQEVAAKFDADIFILYIILGGQKERCIDSIRN